MAEVEHVLGIDLGIASCGWALLAIGDARGEIAGAGVRCWEAPEVPKTSEPKNQQRRLHRGQRRVIRRRRQRMGRIRRLFQQYALLASSSPEALKIPGLDPWRLRAEGLDRRLTPAEFAIVLGHIANHRGFRSNSKRDRGANAAGDTSKMLKAIDATREKLSKYRTIGEMLATDPEFSARKRNREGDYSRTVLRCDHEIEVERLFARQREVGNPGASTALEAAFCDVAFSQRPLADSWDNVGMCPFEAGEKRTAKHSRSFELFRFLARLTSLRVGGGRDYGSMTEDEIKTAVADFGTTKSMSFARLRKVVGITADRFEGVPPDEESKKDVVARSGAAAEGTVTLKACIGAAAWSSLLSRSNMLDRIGEILTFIESSESIRRELDALALEPAIVHAIMGGVDHGDFAKFRGAGHISAKAARKIIPHLLRGLTYDKACTEAGYRHTDRVETEISNPVARKAVLEAEKQVRAIVNEFRLRFANDRWVPDRIHIELARDVGKSADDRKKIEDGIEKRNKEKDKLRDTEFPADVGQPCQSDADLLRFELWKEQAGWCLYTNQYIQPHQVISTYNSVQVEHILPRSRFGDNSFHNKTLCFTQPNHLKGQRTPFEWFRDEKTEGEWEEFRTRVEANKQFRGMKKRNFLLQNAEEVEQRFKTRNLNDTRYAARALLNRLMVMYPPQARERRVFARPGSLTATLRRAWGMDKLKRDPITGERIDDDRHHALDAIVVAATTEPALNRLTRAFQEAERRGLAREFAGFDLPWPGFVENARNAYQAVFVSRAERRRARGKAHDATIKQVRDEEGESVVYERKSIEKLTIADLDRIPVPEPNGKVAEPQKLRDATVAALRTWIEAGKPKDAKPRSPRGDEIRKVRVATAAKIGVSVRGGTADRSEIVRVDVFVNGSKRGRASYLYVPVYAHQIVEPIPPQKAFALRKPYAAWPEVGSCDAFIFSLSKFSLVRVDTEKESHTGYFRGVDTNDGRLSLTPQYSSSEDNEIRLSPTRVVRISKLTVDRLGRVFEVPRETRTWRGEVCT